MKFIIGKKIEMTQQFMEDGTVVPVTRILAGPCFVTAKKEANNKRAIQVAWQEAKKASKPMASFYTKIFKNEKKYKELKEFRLPEADAMFDKLEVGSQFDVTAFESGDIVKVQGTSKGKGFQGVVKRHGFHGQMKTHGNKDQLRMPGSIGATGPAKVFKGTRMGGQMGNVQVSALNLEIVGVNKEKNEIIVKGGIPGARHSVVYISGKGDFEVLKQEVKEQENKKTIKQEIKKEETKKVEEVKTEEVKNEDKKETK